MTEPQVGDRRWRVCTIAARNYLPSTLLLARSLSLHHRGIPFSVLLVDADRDYGAGQLPFELVVPEDLPMSADTFGQMATYYDVLELSTALKPFLLQLLLDRGEDAVMYLDPDIEVYAPLDDLFDRAETSEIVLTPHVTEPVPRDGLYVREESFLISGQFNLGFIAVSDAARPFLRYWKERTRLFGIIDPGRGYFTDQRWVDAVPTMFPHVVVRDRTCNVAYWNLHERKLEGDGGGRWTVDGKPLRFFHFSGHDAADPFRLSRHLGGPPRVRVDKDPPLRRMLRQRAERLERIIGPARPPYRWARAADGTVLAPPVRRLYWEAVRAAEEAGTAPPPHAFLPGDGFGRWLASPSEPGSPVSRHLLALWEDRSDLKAAFPDPTGRDARNFVTWAAEQQLTRWPAPPAHESPTPPHPRPGVNLVGYLRGEFGVGHAGRLLTRVVRAAGLPLATTSLSPPEHSHGEQFHATTEGTPFSLDVLAVNADALIELVRLGTIPPANGRARVGVWYWEVGLLPSSMRGAEDHIEEIWCASDHVRAAIAPWAQKPVLKHPLVFDIPQRPTALARADLVLPADTYLFGFVFDYASVSNRKNPLGLIEAYTRAFAPGDGARLALKSIHSERFPAEAAAVYEAVDRRPDIILIDGHWTGQEMRAFFGLIDCYVSLHRSEGLGLTIAAAMAAGTPAIATGWSGNLEFMDGQNSVLVPYDLVEVGPNSDPYPPTAAWADPDLDAAADSMLALFGDPDLSRRYGERGRRSLALSAEVETAAASWLVAQCDRLTGTPVPA